MWEGEGGGGVGCWGLTLKSKVQSLWSHGLCTHLLIE